MLSKELLISKANKGLYTKIKKKQPNILAHSVNPTKGKVFPPKLPRKKVEVTGCLYLGNPVSSLF